MNTWISRGPGRICRTAEHLPHVRIGTSGWHYQHWRGPYYRPRGKGMTSLFSSCHPGVSNAMSPSSSFVHPWTRFEESLRFSGPSRFAPHAPLKSDRKNAAARINARYHLLFRTGTVGFCVCLD